MTDDGNFITLEISFWYFGPQKYTKPLSVSTLESKHCYDAICHHRRCDGDMAEMLMDERANAIGRPIIWSEWIVLAVIC